MIRPYNGARPSRNDGPLRMRQRHLHAESMMRITAQIPIFSGRMPGKSMNGFSGRQNRVRDQRFHFPVVPDDRKMLARLRAGPGRACHGFSVAVNPGGFDRDAK